MSNQDRLDHRIIARLVPEGSRVLDLGCGDGELLVLLEREKRPKCRGSNSTRSPFTNASPRA